MNVRDVWVGPMRVSFVTGSRGALEYVSLGDVDLEVAEYEQLRQVFEAFEAGTLDALPAMEDES